MEREKTVTFPTSVYLTIDSKDRNQTTLQDWNIFTLQKPQALLDSFAKKLMVSEVRFPWYIPNVTPLNNTFTVSSKKGLVLDALELVVVPSGFYSPLALTTTINAIIATRGYDSPPILSYDVLTNRYTWNAGTVPSVEPFAIWFFNYTTTATPPTEQQYNTTASLMHTLGFDYDQVSGTQVNSNIQGQPTQTLYTSYVDIASTRLTRFQKVRDGDTANNSQASLICRLYLADEASNPLVNLIGLQGVTPNGAGIGNFPFLIHRQFKNAKAICWNPDSFVDYFDVTVLDEYNNVVPLIPQPVKDNSNTRFNAQYPDFQITLVCSE